MSSRHPYTPEDREDDRRCLEEVIPKYRANPGWQTEEALRFCAAGPGGL